MRAIKGSPFKKVNPHNTIWYKDAACTQPHRIGAPAVEYRNGGYVWYVDGVLHRVDGPAMYLINGNKEWWQNGKLHRENGPAVVRADGSEEWWQNGEYHRLDGPAVIDPDTRLEEWLVFNQESDSEEIAEFLALLFKEYGEEAMTVTPYDVLKSIFLIMRSTY